MIYKCIRCGKSFLYMNGSLCPECDKKIYEKDNLVKPPLGLSPPAFSDGYRNRFIEVGDAIDGYIHHEEYIKIPMKWIQEYNTLCVLLADRKGK